LKGRRTSPLVGVRAALSPQSQKLLVAAGPGEGLAAGFRAPDRWRFLFALKGVSGAIPGRQPSRGAGCGQVEFSDHQACCLAMSRYFRCRYEVASLLDLPRFTRPRVLASLMSWALSACWRQAAVAGSRQLERLDPWLPSMPSVGLGWSNGPGLPTRCSGWLATTIEALLGTQSGLALSQLAGRLLVVKAAGTGFSNANGFCRRGVALPCPWGRAGKLLWPVAGRERAVHWPLPEPPAYANGGQNGSLCWRPVQANRSLPCCSFELTHEHPHRLR